ncbi:MAG: diguanylate cyclase domain-containing protein [Neptuniibacter sp.]
MRSSNLVMTSTIIALGYFLMGMIGQMMAIPPGYATLFWPASGLALGASLIWKTKALPGVFLGSFFVNLYISNASTEFETLIVLPVLIALGATLQAYVGARLVNRLIGFPFSFHTPKQALHFVLLGGPVSALVNSTISCFSLLLFGVIPAEQFPINWLNWWLGDSLGVIVLVPWLLILFPKLSNARAPYSSNLLASLLLITGATFMFSVAIAQFEQKKQNEQFNKNADLLAQTLQSEVDSIIDTLYSLSSFILTNKQLNPELFRHYTAPILARKPSIHGLSWNIAFSGSELEQFNQDMSRLYTDENIVFRTTQRSESGDLIPASQRDKHIVVSFIEPLTTNRSALGYDVYSQDLRKQALDNAQRLRQEVSTLPIRLVQEKENQAGVLIFLPVFSPQTEELLGFVTAVLRIGHLTHSALLDKMLPNTSLVLFDPLAEENHTLLYSAGDVEWTYSLLANHGLHSPFPMMRQNPVSVGGHSWTLMQVSQDSFLYQPWGVHLLIVCGLVISGLLNWFMIIFAGHTYEIEHQVTARTKELSKINHMFDSAQKLANVGHWEWNIKTGRLWWSDEIFRIFGRKKEHLNESYLTFIETVHPDDRALVTKALDSAIAEHKDYQVEHRLLLPDGSEKNVYEQGEIIFDDEDNPSSVIGIVQDITERKSAEEQLINKEQIYRQMFENNTAVKLLIDPVAGTIVRANQAACDYYGYSKEELTTMTISQINTLSPAEVKKEMTAVDQGLKKICCFKHRLASGEIRDVEVHTGPVQLSEQHLLYSIVVDVTSRNHYEQELETTAKELQQERTRLSEIIWATNIGTWEWNISTGATQFNERWAEILGFSLQDLQPTSIATQNMLMHPDDLARSQQIMQETFSGQRDHYELESRMRHKKGHWVWVLIRGKVTEWSEDGQALRMSGTETDITARKQRENEINRLATTDSLTGLANRSYFNKRLSETIKISARTQQSFTLMMLDLDGFKPVNDKYGHPVGDALLKEFAWDLASLCRESDVVARLGGDEFVIILTSTENSQGAETLAERILQKNDQVRRIEGNKIKVGVSIGISSYPELDTQDKLIKAADDALYEAKHSGRNMFKTYG